MSLLGDPVYPVVTLTSSKSDVKIVAQIYSNRLFVIIADANIRNFGTLIQVRKDFTQSYLGEGSELNIGQEATYDINVLFGIESSELLVASRIFASKLDIEKPILFSLALKNFEKLHLQEIANELFRLLKSN